jgi:hypothetical protein
VQADGAFTFINARLKNYWSLFGNALYFRGTQDDRATRGGPSMASPSARGGSAGVESDGRKRVRLSLSTGYDSNDAGGWSWNGSVSLRFIPTASLEISSGPSFSRNHALAQYVDTVVDPVAEATYGSRYVFGTLNQKEFSLRTASTTFFAEDVLRPTSAADVGWRLSRVQGVRAAATFDFTRQGSIAALVTTPRRITVDPATAGRFTSDRTSAQVARLNVIFRWEWRPDPRCRRDRAAPGQSS